MNKVIISDDSRMATATRSWKDRFVIVFQNFRVASFKLAP